jgi:hypothetical protein
VEKAKEAAMKTLAMLAGAVVLGAMPAAAQTQQQPPAVSPCQAEPDRNGSADGGTGRQQPPAGDLTQKLDPCDGVLKPPPTGDGDMTEPAPDLGNMPIIRPGEVPPQPPGN